MKTKTIPLIFIALLSGCSKTLPIKAIECSYTRLPDVAYPTHPSIPKSLSISFDSNGVFISKDINTTTDTIKVLLKSLKYRILLDDIKSKEIQWYRDRLENINTCLKDNL